MKSFWDEQALKMRIMTSKMIFPKENLGVISIPIIQLTGHRWYCTVNPDFLIKVLCFAKKGLVCGLTAWFFTFWHLLKTSYDIISHRNVVDIVGKISSILSLQLTHFSRVQTYPACEMRWWQEVLHGKGNKQNFFQLKDKTLIIFRSLINRNNKIHTELQGG